MSKHFFGAQADEPVPLEGEGGALGGSGLEFGVLVLAVRQPQHSVILAPLELFLTMCCFLLSICI